jgi:hypothetical protein
MCCGRGGDLPKYLRMGTKNKPQKITLYTGLDFSANSIQSAKQRFVEKFDKPFPSIFIIADMTNPNQSVDKVLSDPKLADIRK